MPRSARLAAAVFAVCLAALLPATAAAQQRTETLVRSKAPDANKVVESYVSLRAPLPASAPPHPAACDRIGYLRFRPRVAQRRPARQRRRSRARRAPALTGQRRAQAIPKPSSADAVVVAMPGFLGGAASFDQVARNVVTRASRNGRRVEFWALDRRANCLEDHYGVRAAAAAGNPDLAVRYYFLGEEVNGRRFAGFRRSEDVPYLDGFGLERTVRDWRTVLTREIPSASQRRRKLVCGGHSLGGPITAALAGWDFDGNPGTTADAGHRLCGGFFGLDTSLNLRPSQSGAPGISEGVNLLLALGGQGRFINAPPATPQSIQLLEPSGVAAFQKPQDEATVLDLVPRTPELELAFRVIFARNAAEFATGIPNVRDFRVRNEVLIGAVFDDNSSPISIFRSSVGTYDGAPVQDKDFPLPSAFAPFAGDNRLMAPAQPNGPLYGWRNYNRVGVGAPIQTDRTGQPYTSRASEVSSVRQLARVMYEAPATFTEQYFPTRLMTDVSAAQAGDRSGSLANLRYERVKLTPSLLVQGGDGIGGTSAGSDGGADRSVTLPGYDHLDVTTAAARQNNRRREGSSEALAGLVTRALARSSRRR